MHLRYVRGIGYLMLESVKHGQSPGPTHFYSSSGGNAGLACVMAARNLERPATVVVPLTTKPLMINKIRTAGATDVIQHGESWREADAYLRESVVSQDPNGIYITPFDSPDIWQGVSTLMDEVKDQLSTEPFSRPDLVICSVGGGGLFSGVMLGLKKQGWEDVSVLALETKGAESLHASLAENELVTLPKITSLATSLGATRVAQNAFEQAHQKNVKSLLLSDAEAAMGCWRFADDERMIVEMACGICIAMCYDGRLEQAYPELSTESKVVIIVCGGSNVTSEILEQYKKDFGSQLQYNGIG